MSSTSQLDDSTIEAIVRGDEVGVGWRGLAAFAAEVRTASERPPPQPSPELAHLIARGAPRPLRPAPERTARRGAPRHRAPRRGSVLARVAGVGVVAKVCLGATAAAAVAGAGAGAAAVLPGAPGHAVRDAIEVVTPVDFAEREPATTGEPDHAPSAGADTRSPAGTEGPAASRQAGDGDRPGGTDGEADRRDDERSPGGDAARGGDDGDDEDRDDLIGPPAAEGPAARQPAPPGGWGDDGDEPAAAPGVGAGSVERGPDAP